MFFTKKGNDERRKFGRKIGTFVYPINVYTIGFPFLLQFSNYVWQVKQKCNTTWCGSKRIYKKCSRKLDYK